MTMAQPLYDHSTEATQMPYNICVGLRRLHCDHSILYHLHTVRLLFCRTVHKKNTRWLIECRIIYCHPIATYNTLKMYGKLLPNEQYDACGNCYLRFNIRVDFVHVYIFNQNTGAIDDLKNNWLISEQNI